ncbi:hypothetical protein EV189_0033 [Motilibacter rhizosphaerae]|uniref:Uncharacterized protein n=1 Tax=Motilibacter rhizosphaerae TaxID=598652 RepID=A0A4Q7NUL2_9ACTN|nr:hypothetical protein [Motilibacter rhizosphaerae]RZS90805.1 hypothetical protein EV189_0033 [Motilibacter rhizosphaerae]
MADTHKITLHGPGEPLTLQFEADRTLDEWLDQLSTLMREGQVTTLPLAKGSARVNMAHVWGVTAKVAKA